MTEAASPGRPSSFTQELADEICDRISLGESVIDITKDEHMPCEVTVYRWLRAEANEQFRKDYARAREVQADRLVDEMGAIADDGRNDWVEKRGKEGELLGYQLNGEAVARSRLRLDDRKWRAGKLKPKVYGDKIDVTSGGEQIKPTDQSDVAALVAALLATANARKSGVEE